MTVCVMGLCGTGWWFYFVVVGLGVLGFGISDVLDSGFSGWLGVFVV